MTKEHCMLKAKILQEEGKTQREIAEALGVTDRTVRNYLKRIDQPGKKRAFSSKLDPFKDFIDTILEEDPFFNREILLERLRKQGYTGRISILRDYAAVVTRRITKAAVLRFETEPGRQAQVDWKEFGKRIVDGKETKLYAFVMVLGYSRKPFVRFTTSMNQATLLACHVLRCRIRRPETKGKVERTIGYLGDNFWPRMEGRELSLDELNAEVGAWIEAVSEKPIADLGESRSERFRREKSALKPVPAVDFDVREAIPLHVGREGTIRHEGNRYTVPAAFIGEMASLLVHPLHREVELRLPDGSSRRFTLAPKGSHARIEFPGDGTEQLRRWRSDRDRVARRRRPRRRPALSDIAVTTGRAAAYDEISRTMGEPEGIPA